MGLQLVLNGFPVGDRQYVDIMLCQACRRFSSAVMLCRGCRREMRPVPDRVLPNGLLLVAAFEHSGPAKSLVHHLKYRGLAGYADLVAATVAPRLPRLPVVPVPRALSRRLRYGVDPARVLARRIGAHLDVPVIDALTPPLHAPRRAGGDHSRSSPAFGLRLRPDTPVIVVDDVVTTGSTLISATNALGERWVHAGVAANAVAEVSTLRRATNLLVAEE